MSITKRDLLEVGSSLASGVGLGAILMYLADPDIGYRRRRYLARRACDASGQLTRRARSLTGAVLGGKPREYVRQLRDSAVAPAVAVCGALSLLALGAAGMYLLDPSMGQRRRAMVRNQVAQTARQTGQTIGASARYLGQQARHVVGRA